VIVYDHMTNWVPQVSLLRPGYVLHHTVTALAAAFGRGGSKEILEIDERIEEYQDLAVQKWLPLLFSADTASQKSWRNVEQALNGLSQLLSERHNDPWLRDLTGANRQSPIIREAVRLLADSVLRVETSDESQAQREATKALPLFQRSHVPAGELRSKLVLILVEQFEHRDWPCEAMAQTIRRQPSLQRYAWIQ
jgi:hypothetical protein